jgi:hypothetical protein
MQIKIRQPVTVDVTRGEESTFVIRFVTENEHEAAVTVSGELLSELIAKLQAAEAPVNDAEPEEPEAPPAPQIAKDDETRRVLLRALTSGVTRAA